MIYLLLILLVDEGFRGEAYQLPGEVEWTIGYGHYGSDVRDGDTITEAEAKVLLGEEVRQRLISITKIIPKFNTFPESLRAALFSEHYRGSIRQSPKTCKLINEGKFAAAADEFLDNNQYRNAYQLGIPGIRSRMERLVEELRKHGKK